MFDSCLVEHDVGYVLDGVSLKFIDDVAQKLNWEFLSKKVIKLHKLFFLNLLFLSLRKWLDVSVDECDCNGLIIFQFHLFKSLVLANQDFPLIEQLYLIESARRVEAIADVSLKIGKRDLFVEFKVLAFFEGVRSGIDYFEVDDVVLGRLLDPLPFQ